MESSQVLGQNRAVLVDGSEDAAALTLRQLLDYGIQKRCLSHAVDGVLGLGHLVQGRRRERLLDLWWRLRFLGRLRLMLRLRRTLHRMRVRLRRRRRDMRNRLRRELLSSWLRR
jgi:hypothetical protein